MQKAKGKRSNLWRNGTSAKLMERLVWLEPVREGIPVAFRAQSKVSHPIVKIHLFKVTVLLPLDMARFIPMLARFVRVWRVKRKRAFNGKVSGKPKRLSDLAPFQQPDLISSSQTNGHRKPAFEPPSEPTVAPQQSCVHASTSGVTSKPPVGKSRQRESPALPSFVNVVCLRCQRMWQVPPEWLKLCVVRCGYCNRPLETPDEK